MPNKPRGGHCINGSPGKTSYLLIKKKGPDFPAVGTLPGNISAALVRDDDIAKLHVLGHALMCLSRGHWDNLHVPHRKRSLLAEQANAALRRERRYGR